MSDERVEEKDIGALWAKTGKTGSDFFTGTIEIEGVKHRIVVFKNRNKKAPNQPDWKIFAAREQGAAPQRQARPKPAHSESFDSVSWPDTKDDDGIPF